MPSCPRPWFHILLAAVATITANSSFAAIVTHKVRIYWGYESIEIELYGEDSPRHVANFLRYVDDGLYDNSYSHRSVSGSARFIQGGSFSLPEIPTWGNLASKPIVPPYGPIKNEYNPANGLFNSQGTLAAAQLPDDLDSATAGWFINISNNSVGFQNYTVFGQVTRSFNLLQSLAYQPFLYQVNSQYASASYATANMVYSDTPGNEGWFVPSLDKFARIPVIPGDINMDGIVSQADLDEWEASQAGYGMVTNFAADTNGDGKVDEDDRQIVIQHMGSGQLNNLAGDFNGNGVVNQADYLWWKTLYGSTDHLYADANGDGIVDAADYTVWRNNLGASLPGALQLAGAANVPEPSTAVAAVILGLGGLATWRRRRKAAA